ncbi:hypothetical protein [Verrucomicrobium spinosum]|uniref:hypothetical protein n=1 Tax=Verrucomicrobium spinosum TaxID=2736 RepID=UPI0001744D71|nr:hypothetical protein [Verrucomicrobium spinosum]
MKFPRLLTAVALATAATTLGAPAPKAPVSKPAEKAKPLFFGIDTAPWLPKAPSLPKAGDVEVLAQRLSSRVRNLDPFGVPTFPREDTLPLIVEEDPARPTPKLTLNQALQTLKLNAVNLDTREFIIGARSVFEGDVIELSFRGELFRALVVEVGATAVVFRDIDRAETGLMPHSMVRNLRLEPMQTTASRLDAHLAPLEPPSPPNP